VAGQSFSSASGNVTAANHGDNDYWIVKLDAAGNIVWNKLLGGSGTEAAQAVQQTADGGYIIAGYSVSSASGNVTGTNHGTYDYWIIKLDASGNIVWNKLLGGTSQDEGHSIVQAADGGYVVAGYASSSESGNVTELNHGSFDYWIVKLDTGGNIVWDRLLGGTINDYPYSLQRTADGGYIIAGYSGSSNDGDISANNHGGFDYWIIKLDAGGNVVYQ
jgi:hypothetical protein